MKNLVKPKKYCEDNVEFYGGEVGPVWPSQPVYPTPTPTPPPGGSKGSGGNKKDGPKFSDFLH